MASIHPIRNEDSGDNGDAHAHGEVDGHGGHVPVVFRDLVYFREVFHVPVCSLEV